MKVEQNILVFNALNYIDKQRGLYSVENSEEIVYTYVQILPKHIHRVLYNSCILT